MLIRYGDVVADYHTLSGNTALIIRCSGMPWLPSSDNDMPWLQTSWYDVVMPDYYGYARSLGTFTPSWCIQTVLDTAKTFRSWTVLDVRWNTSLQVHYDHIIVVGASFGGRVACMSPKFDTSLKEVVLCYPQLAPAKYGTLWLPEVTDVEFWRVAKQWYWWLICRWAEQERQEMFADQWPYIPTIHYDHLRDVSVFAWHGTADEVIHYTRTRDFCDQLVTRNPDGAYQYVQYYGLGHGWLCRKAIMQGWLRSKQKG